MRTIPDHIWVWDRLFDEIAHRSKWLAFVDHADFVGRVLARAGVRESDLGDATQEIFVVVTLDGDGCLDGCKRVDGGESRPRVALAHAVDLEVEAQSKCSTSGRATHAWRWASYTEI